MGGLAVPESLKIDGFLSIFIIRAVRLGTQADPASLKVYGFPDIFMVWVERKAALATPESLKKMDIYKYLYILFSMHLRNLCNGKKIVRGPRITKYQDFRGCGNVVVARLGC